MMADQRASCLRTDREYPDAPHPLLLSARAANAWFNYLYQEQPHHLDVTVEDKRAWNAADAAPLPSCRDCEEVPDCCMCLYEMQHSEPLKLRDAPPEHLQLLERVNAEIEMLEIREWCMNGTDRGGSMAAVAIAAEVTGDGGGGDECGCGDW
mmetsp:Transcript_42911/g.86315  ORF Transcript_42911/g.86315 Transcript_42911/m.86315 type:complete len:152 (-) Transcript_42911:306-761(-)